MHELSMADGILKAVISNAEQNDATEVTEVTIEIGKLALLNPEQVKFMLGVLSEDTIAKDANFVMVEIPIEIKCKECGYIGLADSDDLDHYAPMVECPKCENKIIEVTNGKDCIVKNIVIEKPDD
ncbi:hydrogenase nickel incorporation protein [Methanobrevibacter arboriphilus JCM 13429 = DSM 1125]|uniref:Hydrogenase maturation factor HypA n=1 Tax=Methanobrevibacter arboriphilus JCM 13429 = DSM 1125 TaxID=1300164 RepID=A0A1V6N2B0_METAZ|nr:hydrogenase maturation nickel metallochaperone HypA [Methanobrevibacter arboriphilus]OQD58805.1 hydrogenase nickel incorporation protein [Methanobrevibacter arboriphilus JCM 13429 = DSM 1125]